MNPASNEGAFKGRLQVLHVHVLLVTQWRDSENIAVEVDGTSLVFGLGEHFAYGLQHAKALVADHQSDPVQTTATEPLKEIDPAGLVPFHALSST